MTNLTRRPNDVDPRRHSIEVRPEALPYPVYRRTDGRRRWKLPVQAQVASNEVG